MVTTNPKGLSNVVNVFKSIITGKGTTANTPSKTVNAFLEASTKNVASVLVTALPFAKVGGVTVASKTVQTAVKGFQQAKPLTQIGLGVGGLAVGGAVVKEPTLLIDVAKTPSSIVNVGGNVGKAIKNPSKENIKDIFTENPILSSVGVGAGAVALAGGLGRVAGATTNFLNTQATKQNTQAILDSGSTSFSPMASVGASKGAVSPILSESTPPKKEDQTTAPIEVTKKEKERLVNNKIQIVTQSKAYINKNNRKVYISHRHKRR